LGPIYNPQSPIPNPQSPLFIIIFIFQLNLKNINKNNKNDKNIFINIIK